jgi:Arc/MetJ-type ribon-helix-helix transcriptional regulator
VRAAGGREARVTIDLKPEQQRVIDLAIRSGAYRNPGEAVAAHAVAAHIETGFAQAQRGELTDGDAAVETLRQRRAERLKPRG